MSDTEQRAADMSSWDGPAAMSACADAEDPAACYRSICAGRREGEPEVQSSWALPHHKSPGAMCNAAGVRNSLSRLPQTEGLTNREAAEAHLRAHLENDVNASASARPPRENLVRAMAMIGETRAVDLRDDGEEMPTMFGFFSVFDQWTEIDSIWEGQFLERVAPGAFKRTFDHKRGRIPALFQHGRDPQIGEKLLGLPEILEERDLGAYYEVPLLPTSYNRDLVPVLRIDGYGASFRFRVLQEEFDKRPKASDHNPERLPERTIVEADVAEFGPVTFPAYEGATAGVRSMTDDYIIRTLGTDPERVIDLLLHHRRGHALPLGLDPDHSEDGTREEPTPPVEPARIAVPQRFQSPADWSAYIRGARR